MATKVQRRARNEAAPTKGRSTAASRASEAAETLNILHPERVISIGDRALEVREYGYVEGLKLQVACRPFLDALFGVFSRAAVEPPSIDEISDVMAEHIVVVQWMIAQAITPLGDGGDPQQFVDAVTANLKWIGTLSEEAGDLLTAVWWEVNKRFFTHRLQRRARAARAAVRQVSESASSASTTP